MPIDYANKGEAFRLLGVAQMYLGDYQSAYRNLQLAMRIFGEKNLAVLYFYSGDIGRSIEEFTS